MEKKFYWKDKKIWIIASGALLFVALLSIVLILIFGNADEELVDNKKEQNKPSTDITTDKNESDDNEAPNVETQVQPENKTYKIIYASNLNKHSVAACERLKSYLEGNLAMQSDTDTREAETYEILVGNTNRSESQTVQNSLGEHDYQVKVQGEKLIIAGGNDAAIVNAIKTLMQKGNKSVESLVSKNISFSYDGPNTRQDYLADQSKFLCNWALDFDVPAWMTDPKEKEAALNKPGSRMMSAFHRCEYTYYPENTLEAVISAMKLGADFIEIDVRVTKDGVPILIHDVSLSGHTDAALKCGKNGLPRSLNVSDWTYAQIKQLCVRQDGEDTNFIIPTLDEVIKVCKGKVKLWLDKPEEWNWDDHIYPLVKKHAAWDTCVLPFTMSLDKQKEITATVTQDGNGAKIYSFVDWPTNPAPYEETGIYAIGFWNYLVKDEKFLNHFKDDLVKAKGKMSIVTMNQAMEGGNETPQQWNRMHSVGVNIVLADNGLELQKYIAQTFKAVAY